MAFSFRNLRNIFKKQEERQPVLTEVDGRYHPYSDKLRDLNQLSANELIARIQDYPDQKSLNFDENGHLRTYPIGDIAAARSQMKYTISDEEKRMLTYHFAKITTPELIVSDAEAVRMGQDSTYTKGNLLSRSRTLDPKTNQHVDIYQYEAEYKLVPRPTKTGELQVSLVGVDKDGNFRALGTLDKAFVQAHPIMEPMDITGTMVEKISETGIRDVNYQFKLDLEQVHQIELKHWLHNHPEDTVSAQRNDLTLSESELKFIDDVIHNRVSFEDGPKTEADLAFEKELDSLTTAYQPVL